MKQLSTLTLFLFTISCTEIKPREVTAYFSLDSLFDAQSNLLLSDDYRLQKSAVVNADTATALFIPDSLEWINEFQVFRDMNINKPALIGQYTPTIKPDPNSNLQILSYTAKSEELEVQQLNVYYLRQLENIKRITASSQERNSIFSAGKEAGIEFEKKDGQWKIKSFSLNGFQKMILQDSVLFVVKGTILNPK